jgi:hypothetical protein
MKKLFTLAAAVLASVSMFAADYALGASTFASDQKTSTVDEQTFVLSSAHGGAGAAKYADFGAETIKLTKNTKYTITLPYGFEATSVNIKGYTNDNSKVAKISEFNDVAQEEKSFPSRNETSKATSSYDFALSTEATSFSLKIDNTAQICVLITITGEAASCTAPTIEWNVEPANGAVGAADFTASVTTTPAEHAVVWTSSNEEVATVVDGKIHYIATGSTKITASLTYTGDDYCQTTVSVSKDINVLIDAITPSTNDLLWYYYNALPASKPDNGLNYGQTASGNGLFGIKLNSDGYAWFEKAAVAGKLRVGAYYRSGGEDAYEVDVFACDAEGVAQGEALGSLATASAGVASAKMDIKADVTGIRIVRKTQNEGVLYFIEFEAEKESPTAIDNTNVAEKAVKTIENGQLVIIKNGVKYNAQGTIVR